jgi:hypothetical protein
MRVAVLAAVVVLADTCPLTGPNGTLATGTWGGENAGVIVTDTLMHVHNGCTYGNAPRPTLTGGRFEVTGVHNITAHPVDLGILHPARFTGRVRGNRMTLTVTLTDTSVTLGPVSVELGVEPRMGPCPICRSPASDR